MNQRKGDSHEKNNSLIIHEKRCASQVILTIFIVLGGLTMIYPLLWMVMSSFKENNEIFSSASSLIPNKFHFENYVNGWRGFAKISFTTFFRNSFFISTVGTVGSVFLQRLLHLDLQG